MAVAFVLISTSPSNEHDVHEALSKIKEIIEVHPLFGDYDLIAKVEAEDLNHISQIIIDKIRSIPGINDTKTLMGIKF
jgi:DNA-binding Lrp family transcriptional regulator